MLAEGKKSNRAEVFAAALGEYLGDFSERAGEVKSGGEAKSLHKLRVAARRLRSALALFGDLVPKKKCRKWKQALKRLGKRSGAARDLDVQMEFVAEVLARQKGANGKSLRPGLERLLLRLRQERSGLQADVAKAIERLDSRKTTERIERWLKTFVKQMPHEKRKRGRRIALGHLLCLYIRVLARERALGREENAAELHELRIAAKHLRYALEMLAPLFDDGFEEQIVIAKSWQQTLGEIHDCDVWLARLPEFLVAERKREEAFFGHADDFDKIAHGIEYLEADRRRTRQERAQAFAKAWKQECFAPVWRPLIEG